MKNATTYKYRSNHPYRNPRKQTLLQCQWCADDYLAERSDSKHCCDSHKTLASNERQNKRREQENLYYEQQRQLRIRNKPANVTLVKPAQPIHRIEPQIPRIDWRELEKSVNEMVEKSVKDLKHLEEQRVIDNLNRLFSEIGERILKCSSAGYIRQPDISAIQSKVSRVPIDTRLNAFVQFQDHIEFVNQKLDVYLQDVSRELRKSHSRRLEFILPEEILSGITQLCTPVGSPT